MDAYIELARWGFVNNYDVPHPIWFKLAKLRSTSPNGERAAQRLDREIALIEREIERSMEAAQA